MHERRLSSEALRSNGLSPKTVNWRQPESIGFYTNDPSALPQLDVRNPTAHFLLPLADVVPTGSCFPNATGKEAPAGVGSERSIAKSVNVYSPSSMHDSWTIVLVDQTNCEVFDLMKSPSTAPLT